MSILFRLLLLLLIASFAQAAQAQLSFSLRTGDDATKSQKMVRDSNNCTSTGAGPRVMYVGGRIVNSGGTAATNVVATLTGLSSTFALAGGQPATINVGSIGAGQSAGVYWLVSYGCGTATISPTVSVTSSLANLNTAISLTEYSSISANAGGNVVSTTLGPGAVVGQTIWVDVDYTFGNVGNNDEFFVQPVGNTSFNAACFRLVSSEVRSGGNLAALAVGSTDKFYFRATSSQGGSSNTATVRYFFEYQCSGVSTAARPFAAQTSGSTNLKYTGNFETLVPISYPPGDNPFTIDKSSDITVGPPGTASQVTYTVTISNPSANASRITSIQDILPEGATFVSLHASSQVTAANSSSVPAANASGTLTFTGIPDVSYAIAGNSSLSLVYTVQMPATAGTYVNSAKAIIGTAETPTASSSFLVAAPAPLTVVKSSQVSSDPYNGTTNPKAIPGGRVTYTILVSNPGSSTVTSDSIIILDATPDNSEFYVSDLSAGTGPVLFQDGSPSSGLTYTFTDLASLTDDVDFSSDGGTSWTHVPVAGGSGSDPNVTHIRIRPKGSMQPGSSFSIFLSFITQ